MKCLVLAAGYATRLYPLTENFPKPLLTVGEKTILDWLLDDIDQSGSADEYVIISNHRFVRHFEEWAAQKKLRAPITVLNDGTSTNETRLGAVQDIRFAVGTLGINDDILVIAGDNVLDFSLNRFTDYARGKNAPCVMRYFEPDEAKLKKAGVAQVDERDRITRMEEKPPVPFANWCTPPFYYYPRQVLHFIGEAINADCNTDAPGSFIAWLSGKTAVYAMLMPGRRFDIGSHQSYAEVRENYKGILEK